MASVPAGPAARLSGRLAPRGEGGVIHGRYSLTLMTQRQSEEESGGGGWGVGGNTSMSPGEP